jgi:amino-acid N-acetyltransferase
MPQPGPVGEAICTCSVTFCGQTKYRTGVTLTIAHVDYLVRSARTSDVRAIRRLVDANVASGRLLDKATVTLYEDIQEFVVVDRASDGRVIASGALHVMWEDLAEIRTIAVDESFQREGVGHMLVEALLARARELGVRRVFVLTFAVKFFGRLGFEEITGEATSPEVYAELLRSYDEGVAEFLDLDRVKPNTLGNTRMLLRL